jgi:hypothetical protein
MIGSVLLAILYELCFYAAFWDCSARHSVRSGQFCWWCSHSCRLLSVTASRAYKMCFIAIIGQVGKVAWRGYCLLLWLLPSPLYLSEFCALMQASKQVTWLRFALFWTTALTPAGQRDIWSLSVGLSFTALLVFFDGANVAMRAQSLPCPARSDEHAMRHMRVCSRSGNINKYFVSHSMPRAFRVAGIASKETPCSGINSYWRSVPC